MKSIKDLNKLIEKSRQFYYFNFSYNEHLEMLTVLHIHLFLMCFDCGGMVFLQIMTSFGKIDF